MVEHQILVKVFLKCDAHNKYQLEKRILLKGYKEFPLKEEEHLLKLIKKSTTKENDKVLGLS